MTERAASALCTLRRGSSPSAAAVLRSYGGEGLEHNQNGPRQVLCDWLDKAGGCTLFDFPTKGILSEAVEKCQYWRLRDSKGKPPGLIGW